MKLDAGVYVRLRCLARLFRQQHLPTMRCFADMRGAVDDRAKVVVVEHKRLSGMQSHAYLRRIDIGRPRIAGQRRLREQRAVQRVRRIGKRCHERIALGLHLMPVIARDGISQNRIMRLQNGDEAIAVLLPQLRRPDDVRKQKGHRTRGQRRFWIRLRHEMNLIRR